MEDKEKQHVILSTEEIRDLIRDGVREAFTRIGVDARDPLAVQRDLQFVRDLRTTSESIRGKAIMAAVGLCVIGVLGLTWIGLRQILGR